MFFLLLDRLCVPKRSKSLRNSVQHSLLLALCASALHSTTCITKLCWCRSYCTHYYLMCFGTTCHSVVIGHALHPVTLAILLHMLLFPVLRHFLAQCGHRACPAPRTSNEPTAQYLLVDDHGLRTYKFLLRAYDLPTCPSTLSA